ncbi:hypothetical protein J6590_047066 [Homalodisca vitripennis]|nr:hypothetical protein J6590_047066 [Homalodisca vitripennis]
MTDGTKAFARASTIPTHYRHDGVGATESKRGGLMSPSCVGEEMLPLPHPTHQHFLSSLYPLVWTHSSAEQIRKQMGTRKQVQRQVRGHRVAIRLGDVRGIVTKQPCLMNVSSLLCVNDQDVVKV